MCGVAESLFDGEAGDEIALLSDVPAALLKEAHRHGDPVEEDLSPGGALGAPRNDFQQRSFAATWRKLELDRIRVLRIRESGSLANFDSWRPKTPGLLAKRPSKRPEKDPKNRFTGPDFENTESNRGSRVLILRIRSSSSPEFDSKSCVGHSFSRPSVE